MTFPDDVRYTAEHEWAREQGGVVTVGITGYATDQLGDVVFVELPDVGRTLSAHQTFGTVESVKAVSELLCPVAGEVVEVNGALSSQPELVNSDPYGKAWMVVLELADPSAVGELMDAAAYRAYVESESKK